MDSCAPGRSFLRPIYITRSFRPGELGGRLDFVRAPDAEPRGLGYIGTMFSFEIHCSNCGWRTISGVDDAVARLRLIGLLRRDCEPDEDVVAALLVEAAPRMTCPLCKEKRLIAKPTTDVVDADDWQAATLCDVCRQPIDPERLEAIPGTKRCAGCQGKAETGQLTDEPDYCPNCGAIVETRVSRGAGITRYKRVCTGQPPCRL